MGSNQSIILDSKGQPIGPRRCILLVTPPSYEVSRLVSQIPNRLGFDYVSVGQMIRDQINKKTNYSRIILENLEKQHKINDNILDILLKNAALLGNFIIRFAPRDKQELGIWRKFVGKVVVEMAVVVRGEVEEAVTKRASFREKMTGYEREVEWVKDLVGKEGLLVLEGDEGAGEKIVGRLKEKEQFD